ncbi:unnamed protein product [Moneuplotes crassus]|uniref:Uncharacterized protein n=1 Tax=Euplotes crassus TaxID=5936 RepID=A0AAD1XTT9_EUPCR|nr:unnamed protein product [Moneuplotes crassus]
MLESPTKHPLEVSKAVEFKEIKKLPKFSHPSMACINPVHAEVDKLSPPRYSRMGITGSPIKYNEKEIFQKILPDHLIRPPPEVLNKPINKEKTVEDIIRIIEKRESRRLTSKETRDIYEKENKKEENRKRKEQIKENSKTFFKECQLKLEEVNAKKESPKASKLAKSVIGALFHVKLKGMRKLYNELMGTNPKIILKSKFLEFAKMVLKGQKLTDTDLKELYSLYCKKNKKKENEMSTTKAKAAKSVMKKWLRKGTADSKDSPFGFHDTLNSKKSSNKQDTKNEESKFSRKKSRKRDEKKTKAEKPEEIKLSMEALTTSYDEYLKQEENLSGVLNTKTLNLKNIELKDKINYWRQGKDLRELTTEKINEKEQEVDRIITKYCGEITVDKELLEACRKDYTELMKERHTLIKQENTLNDFLLELNDFKILEIRDMVKCMDNYRTRFYSTFTMLNTFVNKISRECVLNQFFFSFFDVADLVVKMTPSKADYAHMIGLLNDTKAEYIKEKVEILKKELKQRDNPEVKITDEDLIPLELIRQTLEKLKEKFKEGCGAIEAFIDECRDVTCQKICQLQVENTKIKKTIENNVFIAHISKIMDKRREEVFSLGYKIRILHMAISKTLFTTARDINMVYFNIIGLSKDNNLEFGQRLTREMEMFNNKPFTTEDLPSENLSEPGEEVMMRAFQRLGAFREAMNSARKKNEKKLSTENGLKIDEEESKDSFIDETFERMIDLEEVNRDKSEEFNLASGRPKSSFRDKFGKGEQPKFTHLDEEDEEDREAIEEKKRREEEEREWMAKYRDTDTGEPFNPIKKFGLIDKDYLVYDNATSSYPLNLPADYYQRYVKSTVPSKKDGKWFIRPHHIEKLTTHVKSIKDDVLNTNYYSHYHDESKNKMKVDETAEAIQGLENKISQIKDYVKMIKMNNGTWDPDYDEILATDPEINREARNRYEALMKEGKTGKKNLYMLKAFESLLYEQRRIEKEMLNLQRAKEYEKNRPPQEGWYMLKTEEFNKELYRNRMDLKPNNQNRVYLDNLKDPYLY